MARWGNALGGWRKQKRDGKGRFGSGSAYTKARKASLNKAKNERREIAQRRKRSSREAMRKTKPGLKRRREFEKINSAAFIESVAADARHSSRLKKIGEKYPGAHRSRQRRIAVRNAGLAAGATSFLVGASAVPAIGGSAIAIHAARKNKKNHGEYFGRKTVGRVMMTERSLGRPLTKAEKKKRNRRRAAIGAGVVLAAGAASMYGREKYLDSKATAVLYHHTGSGAVKSLKTESLIGKGMGSSRAAHGTGWAGAGPGEYDKVFLSTHARGSARLVYGRGGIVKYRYHGKASDLEIDPFHTGFFRGNEQHLRVDASLFSENAKLVRSRRTTGGILNKFGMRNQLLLSRAISSEPIMVVPHRGLTFESISSKPVELAPKGRLSSIRWSKKPKVVNKGYYVGPYRKSKAEVANPKAARKAATQTGVIF